MVVIEGGVIIDVDFFVWVDWMVMEIQCVLSYFGMQVEFVDFKLRLMFNGVFIVFCGYFLLIVDKIERCISELLMIYGIEVVDVWFGCGCILVFVMWEMWVCVLFVLTWLGVFWFDCDFGQVIFFIFGVCEDEDWLLYLNLFEFFVGYDVYGLYILIVGEIGSGKGILM